MRQVILLLEKISKRQSLSAVFLVFIFAVYFLPKWWLLFQYGDLAFGYDTGIYRHIINGYVARAFDLSLPPFGFTAFSTLLKWLGTSTDYIMFGWYSIFSIFIFVTWYIVVHNETNKKTALIATFLFAISVTQMEFYVWYYFRQYMALWFVLIAILFWQKRSVLLPLPLVLIGIIHPISLFPLIIFFIFLSIRKKEERIYLVRSLGISIAAIIFLNGFELYAYAKTAYVQLFGLEDRRVLQTSEMTGQFISFSSYVFRFGILYIPIALYGLYLFWRKYTVFLSFLIIQLFFVIFGIFFQNRYIVYLDIAIIFFAACALSVSLDEIKNKFILRFSGFLFIVAYMTGMAVYAMNYMPLISREDFSQIIALHQLPPASLVMTVSSQYAPWIYGYTEHVIVAPGMFEANLWSRTEWEIFWSTPDQEIRHELLSRYPGRFLYVYIGTIDMDIFHMFSSDPRAEQLTSHIWKYSL